MILYFDQICKIFSILGTPNEENWEGVTKLPNFVKNIQNFERKDLKELMNVQDENTIDLLEKMFVYNPDHRLPAQKLLEHNYFDDIWESSSDNM